MSSNNLLIIDASWLIYRSYFTYLKINKGTFSSSIFFFLKSLISILKKIEHNKVLIVFDSKGGNFRHETYPDYKKNRPKISEQLIKDIDDIIKLLDNLSIAYIKKDGYEADDLISSFIKELFQKTSNLTVSILSKDKDLYQLINNKVNIINLDSSGKLSTFDEEQFFIKFGFKSESFIDYLSITGDAADNINGVGGIGHITSSKLIQKHGSLENIYQNIEKLPKSIQEILKRKSHIIFRNQKLITLKNNIVIADIEKILSLCTNWQQLKKWWIHKILRRKKV